MSTRTRTAPHYLKDFHCQQAVLTPISQSKIQPTCYNQAVKNPDWCTAMDAELHALEQNNTWVLTDLPHGKVPIDCKYVYKVKHNLDGSVERLKARLVAKGYTQQEGIDYIDTFSPVAKMVTVRCLLSIAVVRGWHLYQFDVNNAFLHGDLEEEIYMNKPPRYSKGGPNQSKADYSLFVKTTNDSFTALLVYVDDILVASDSHDSIVALKVFLNDHFKIKDLGPLRYFLGIEVARCSQGIHICQHKYALDILADSSTLGSKPVKVPMDQNLKLSRAAGSTLKDHSIYRWLVGRLLYLTITRPDISYVVHTLSQFMATPTSAHLAAAHKVLKYIKTAPAQDVLFSAASSLQLSAYCDSDWASCPDTCRSVTGYCVLLGNSLISWKSKKQIVVSHSSAEAEYIAMATTCSELTWLRFLLIDLQVDHP
ncbi:uncharacterized mitochondrial protein AtMg00810-like [Carya illinoinensis]|uniref:uncharacterized mitochondrial protein AtMg00810-like n=1 Tax=Carya illinoinensis TaxID=32201 RepID=UPI001C71A9AD|nr:uncharacterized mitochondrial protein AtMg00810-like [Carya illinoinensis]